MIAAAEPTPPARTARWLLAKALAALALACAAASSPAAAPPPVQV